MRIEELENPPQWLLDANTAFVNLEIIDGIVHWNGGVWRDGIWHNGVWKDGIWANGCLLYTSPSPRDRTRSRMPSSA